ncbi:hypothetical protein DPMN_004231 [Dreissena polymorpha]|uniref:Uncharacterized protein n=1 Tax=Dreissena polymorpha TaxID=45954 RepID=A0A9D4RTD8_DREPO|nr:hypothetical protein DPMN_004231 [Dreissena polymorpha]
MAALGALLDPRYKKLAFFWSKQRKITQDTLESRMDDLPLRFTINNGDIKTPSKRQKLDFLDFGMDPLQWWGENETRFPKVAVSARR